MNRSFEDAVVPRGYIAHADTLTSPLTYNHVTEQWVTVNNRWNPDAVPGWRLQAANSSQTSMQVMDADSLTSENSFANPTLIAPKSSTFRADSQGFCYTLPPYSLSILRLPVR